MMPLRRCVRRSVRLPMIFPDMADRAWRSLAFIGVRDDGTPTNLPITDDLLLTLASIRSEGNIQPIPSMTVEKRVLRGVEVAVITVLPADAPPVRYKGRTYIRTGPRRDFANLQDERILNERRRHRNLPFDMQPVSFATLADISRSVFEDGYLAGVFSTDVLEANHRSYEERLSSCRVIESIENPVPTVLGSLVLGYVQRFGVGIATARRLLAENGNPAPQFDPRDTHVLVTIRRAP